MPNYIVCALMATQLSLSPPPSDSYEKSVEEFDIRLGNFSPEDHTKAATELWRILSDLGRYPSQLSDDPAIQAKILEARVALAWFHLADENDDAARAAMDDAIRSAINNNLPVRSYGPRLNQLYQERVSVLERGGKGHLEVFCDGQCTLLVNEQSWPTHVGSIYVGGRYRVWIRSEHRDSPWSFHEVEIDEPGEVATIKHTESPATRHDEAKGDETAPPLPVPPNDGPRQDRGRLYIIGGSTALGVGLVLGGGMLIGGFTGGFQAQASYDASLSGAGERESARVRGRRMTGLTVAGLALTPTLAAIGATFLTLGIKQSKQRGTLGLTPVGGPSYLGFFAQGRF